MKKLLVLIMSVGLVAALVGAGYVALYADSESAAGTFSAGSLDLELGEINTVTGTFWADNLAPTGEYTQAVVAGCVDLTNAGTLPGKLTFMVDNLHSDENGTIAPEIQAGDIPGVQYDPTPRKADTGPGELWDMLGIEFCLDNGTYTANNGKCDNWHGADTILKPITGFEDLTSYFSIKTAPHNYAAGKNIILQPGETVSFCVEVLVWDFGVRYRGELFDLTNNYGMTDSASLDLIFGLVQQ